MNKTQIVLIYFLLTVLLIGSSVLLAYQARHYLYEREDPIAQYRDNEIPQSEIAAKIKTAENQERQATLLVFNQSQAFTALATPIPRPTSTPIPPPTPTPVIPANNYKLNFVAGNYVSLTCYDGREIFAKIGDTIEEKVWGNFKILSTSPNPMSVTVQHIQTGVSRVIYFQEGPQPKK